jgi:phage baseplate assembly protein W
MSSRATRAQTLSGSNKREEYYSDFLNSFAKTPVGDQLARVVNERSINQSLKNIILTNRGERLFQPGIGSDVNFMLFENNIESNLSTIEFYIKTSIELHEPRVNLLGVTVDSGQTENEIVINIVYNTINNPTPTLFNYILKRVR